MKSKRCGREHLEWHFCANR